MTMLFHGIAANDIGPLCHCQRKIGQTQGKALGEYRCGPTDGAQPDIDNDAQNCYKIRALSLGDCQPALEDAWQANPEHVDPR